MILAFTTVVDAGIAFKNQYGNVVCGKGQSATDRYGKVLCAKEGGGDAVNLHARAFGSLQLADLGIQPHVIEAVLINHVSGHKAGVADVYNRSGYKIVALTSAG